MIFPQYSLNRFLRGEIIFVEICRHTNFAAHGKAATIIIREYRYSL